MRITFKIITLNITREEETDFSGNLILQRLTMKIITTLIAFLLFCASQGFAQAARVFTYEFSWAKYDCRPDEIKHGQSLLVVSNESSVFFDLNISKQIKNATKLPSPTQRPTMGYIIQKDYLNNKLTFAEKLKTVYKYEESIPEINWEIVEDTLEILGYSCQRALGTFSGRDYTAWYSSEIPISTGPDKFGGLPGLILKIEDTENKIKYELAGIENAENPFNQTILAEAKELSKKEFKNREAHYYLNRRDYSDWANNTSVSVTIRGKPVSADDFFEDIKNDFLCRVNID